MKNNSEAKTEENTTEDATESTKENIKEKKTILIATDCFMPRIDGIARFLEMLIPYLSKYRVIVVAPGFKGSLKKDSSYELHKVKLRNIKIGDYIPARKPGSDIINLIDQADLIFSQTIGPIGATIVKEAHKRKKKIVSFVHSIEWILVEKSLSKANLIRSIMSFLTLLRARNVYSKCNGIIVPSDNVAEIFSARGIKNSKYIIHLGIDPDKFKPSDKAKAKIEIGLEKDDFVVGYVGRIAREKSLDTLKNGFKKIDGKNNKLIFVGDGIPSLEKDLQGPDIIMPGRTDMVVKYINAMDVFVMPSLTETTCLAVLEAMSCEVPVISTKVGNIRGYILDKINGMFFPKENSLYLGIKLNYLKENPDRREEIGKNGRKTVLKEYNYKKTVEKIVKVLELHLE